MVDRRCWLILLLFAALAVMHTWPLATAPNALSRNDNADTILNEWTIAWVAHQAVSDPAHLFDANIFYPDRRTLAYSENLILPAAAGAPLLWAGASPVLVYNLLLLAGFTLTGFAGWYVMWRWTGDSAAAIVTGVILAFNTHTISRFPHLQAQHAEFLPLALLAFDALLLQPRVRQALLLAVWVALQALASIYLVVFTGVALVVGIAARPEDWWTRRRALALLAAAALLGAAVVAPTLLPYKRVGVVRSLDEVARYSAHLRDYLATNARVHYSLWSWRFFGGTALFPGVVALLLAAVAIGSGVAFRDRRARMLVAIGVVGAALSFGPAMPGYTTLYTWVPVLQGLRSAARFGYLVIAATAVLAGFGFAWLRARWPAARWMPAATVLVIALANLDALAAPVGYVRAEPISPLFRRLPATAVVAEFPFYPPDHIFHSAQYMLESTAQWRPMLNGYSGLVPDSYVDHYRDLQGFPDRRAIFALQRAGVTHVFVHYSEMRRWEGSDAVAAMAETPELALVDVDGGVGLYRLEADRAVDAEASARHRRRCHQTPDAEGCQTRISPLPGTDVSPVKR